jgi:hypothetical protein
MPAGEGIRCWGFRSRNGDGVVCTRVESDNPVSDGNGWWHATPIEVNHPRKRRIVATYAYEDEDGAPLFEVVRFDPKDFRQRHKDGKNWVWNIVGIRRVLFHLPQLIAAVARRDLIYIGEGEKDVLAIEEAGGIATCNPMGADQWEDAYSLFLKGARVVVVVDKDEDGARHAHKVYESLLPYAESVELVEAATGKDASDHLAAGHTLDDFVEVPDDDPRLTDGHDPKFAKDVNTELYKLHVRNEARRRFNSEIAGDTFRFSAPGWTLKDELERPDTEPIYRVEALHTTGGNVLLVATYKAGKTILVLNLAKALVDGITFLGKYEVTPLDGKVAIWNYELTRAMWNRWARDLNIQNQERIVVEHLRGRGITPIWDPDFQERTVEWMLANEVQFWILDPTAVAWRGLMQGEGDNIGAATFLAAVDEVKQRASITEAVLTHHTGRVEQKEDEERARGATRLEDWMDAGWYLTKEREQRYLRAQGRDVEQEPLALNYNDETREVTVSGLTKQEAREDAGRHAVVEAMVQLAKRGNERPTTSDLRAAMKMNENKKVAAIASAAEALWIKRTSEGQRKYCELTEIGRRYYERSQRK